MGWRGMFVIGALPAFLVIYIRTTVDEYPAWLQGRGSKKVERRMGKDILAYIGPLLLMAVLMFAFNSFSHGTQDLYPTFLTKGHQLGPQAVKFIAVVANIGAMCGRRLFRGVVGKDWKAASHRHRGVARRFQ